MENQKPSAGVFASTSAAPGTAAASSQVTPGTSTGRRLAKRSILGTRVCAPGEDGKYYCGSISKLKTPPTHQERKNAGLNITSDTRFLVHFDPVPPGYKAPDSKTEYTSSQLIGPGFGSVTTAKLVQGQRVYLTYNGREIQAEVLEHQQHIDEVQVVFTPSGQERAITLSKRIDEVRLLESRKSARLADTDTNFARLADVGSDRKRGSAHSIEVPQDSRKRRPSSNSDSNYYFVECPSEPMIEESPPTVASTTTSMIQPSDNMSNREDCIHMCRAAVALLSLSTSSRDPFPHHCQYIFESLEEQQQASAQQHTHHQRPARASPGVCENNNQVAATTNTHDIIIRDVFSIAPHIAPQSTPIMQVKPSPRPSPTPLQTYNSNANVRTVSIGKMPSAPRRARGEARKCRKHYGMDHKDQWCTQCRWKKACSRFTD